MLSTDHGALPAVRAVALLIDGMLTHSRGKSRISGQAELPSLGHPVSTQAIWRLRAANTRVRDDL